MSNVGGAATMVGDPPALIIGEARHAGMLAPAAPALPNLSLHSDTTLQRACSQHGKRLSVPVGRRPVLSTGGAPLPGLSRLLPIPGSRTGGVASAAVPGPSRTAAPCLTLLVTLARRSAQCPTGTALSRYLGFIDFIINMAPGVLLASVACVPLILFMYRRTLVPPIQRYAAMLEEVRPLTALLKRSLSCLSMVDGHGVAVGREHTIVVGFAMADRVFLPASACLAWIEQAEQGLLVRCYVLVTAGLRFQVAREPECHLPVHVPS